MAALVEEARAVNERLRAFCVLNAADSVDRDNDEAAAELRRCPGIQYLDCPIIRRKAFPNAAAQGKGVLEYTPRDSKAVDELQALIATVYQSETKVKSDGNR